METTKNIILYRDANSTDITTLLANLDRVKVEVKDIGDIHGIETLDSDLIIFSASVKAVKDVLSNYRLHTPVLIVADSVISNISADYCEYILTPVNAQEFTVRIENLFKVKQLKKVLLQTALTDDLTGLYNRQFIHRRLEEEISRAKRYKTPLACLLLDIDFFKVINDMYGYDTGDRLLKLIGEVIMTHARKEDIVGRYGDEEFILVLPNTSEDNAFIVAERIRKDIAQMEFIPNGEEETHQVAVSGGLSIYPFPVPDVEVPQTLVRYSEHALYNAKKKGKNRVVKFSQINVEF